ncbi:Uncharacterised protein [Shigella sonnei]|nr:Uncharacterised protein [Shigella sonnei]
MPVVLRRHCAALDANRFGADAVHAVRWRAVEDGVFTRFAKSANQQFNTFVRATTDQHLFRFYACILRVIFNHRFRLTFRVAVERLLSKLKLHGSGVFVGVQPDVAITAQTTRRLIRRQVADVFTR